MRRRQTLTLVILAIVVVIAYFGIKTVNSYIETIKANMEKLTATPLSNIGVSELADGVYAGRHHVFPVTAEVNVTIQNRRISSIELVKHIHSRGSQAEAIIDKVIEAQSLDVDAISGATYSSMVILRAIEDALRNATWPD